MPTYFLTFFLLWEMYSFYMVKKVPFFFWLEDLANSVWAFNFKLIGNWAKLYFHLNSGLSTLILGWIAFKTDETLVKSEKKISALCYVKSLFLYQCKITLIIKKEHKSPNSLSCNGLLKIPWKARWKRCLQLTVLGGTGMFHCDTCWQLIGCAEEVMASQKA